MLSSGPVIVLTFTHVHFPIDCFRFNFKFNFHCKSSTDCSRLGLLHDNNRSAKIHERRASRVDSNEWTLFIASASRRIDSVVFRWVSQRLDNYAQLVEHHEYTKVVRCDCIICWRRLFNGRIICRMQWNAGCFISDNCCWFTVFDCAEYAYQYTWFESKLCRCFDRCGKWHRIDFRRFGTIHCRCDDTECKCLFSSLIRP